MAASSARAAVSSIRKDKVFNDALRNYGGSKTGREVAFLSWRASPIWIQDLRAGEERAWPARAPRRQYVLADPAGPAPRAPPCRPRRNWLEHAGLSDTDIEKMGALGKDRDDLGNLVVDLNRKGMGSVQEVRETTRAINKGINQVVRSELAQGATDRSLQPESTQVLGPPAAQRNAGRRPSGADRQAADRARRRHQGSGCRHPLQMAELGSREAHQDPRSSRVGQALTGADNYRDATLEIVTLLGDHAKVSEKETRYRELLKEMGKLEKEGGLGLDLDPRPIRAASKARTPSSMHSRRTTCWRPRTRAMRTSSRNGTTRWRS